MAAHGKQCRSHHCKREHRSSGQPSPRPCPLRVLLGNINIYTYTYTYICMYISIHSPRRAGLLNTASCSRCAHHSFRPSRTPCGTTATRHTRARYATTAACHCPCATKLRAALAVGITMCLTAPLLRRPAHRRHSRSDREHARTVKLLQVMATPAAMGGNCH